ncbi:hypothetical protein N8T08_007543 [Aspergillus melleus]|uniref:Uncharacterized protein n=1 Tax=Aspergillus melleus TaxID=138277 RepID=A0ACC3AYH2_9EURO|nr:hypothetical protein N8T08_007543 [Aspergillus melleus]
MIATNMNQPSWESFSSTCSRLECSTTSQDSCYASDEVSMTSTNLIATKTLTTALTAPFRPILKSILKRPCAQPEEGSESGYGSHEMSDGECINASDLSSESEDDDVLMDGCDDESDDEMYYETAWEDDTDESVSDGSDIVFGYDDEDEADSLECSFVSFESTGVRFAPEVSYIEAPYYSDADDEDDELQTGMTCHEMMELARASGRLHIAESDSSDVDMDDEYLDEDQISDHIKELPEEHPSDVADLDKRLFAAYMHGIQGIADPDYKARLRARTKEVKAGRTQSPYLDSQDPDYIYIDQALNHVIGSFHNLVTEEELDELVTINDTKGLSLRRPGAVESLDRYLMGKIEGLLSERLATDDVLISPEELSFFAGGVGFALDHWRPYVCH